MDLECIDLGFGNDGSANENYGGKIRSFTRSVSKVFSHLGTPKNAAT